MPLDTYKDIMAPFSAKFRDGDSTWSLARPQELEAGLKWWQKKVDNGEAEAFVEEREIQRNRVGQTTCAWAVKI